MIIRLLIFFLVSVFALSPAVGCAPLSDTETSVSLDDASECVRTYALPLSEDMGQEYIDSLIFIGESTTYHLKSRGVLRGGSETHQVWSPKSGTLTLSPDIVNARIVYPPTGELLTFAEASSKEMPRYVVLTFGLNGAAKNIRLGKEYFQKNYKSLTDAIIFASPETKLILQSAFPVAENMDMSNYSVDVATLNEYIDRINQWTSEFASSEGFAYLDTANSLKTPDGYLAPELQVGDGHHLTADAYRKILYYIRTHGYKN